MTPERWREVKGVLQAALKRDAADRPAFLDRACATDPVLRREIDSLLAANQGATGFLEAPAAVPARLTAAGADSDDAAIAGRLAGALHDRYLVERELGRGGMATVYLARDLRHKRPVALKVLHPDLAASLGAERFLREIETAANLTHPHVLPVHDSGGAGGLLYYVMPYVAGESLRDRLRREGRLPVAAALKVTREVADALDYAHRHGVVHRDVKPENVLLDETAHALVADFGVARAVARATLGGDAAAGARGDTLTATGLAVGTPAYMSPEQVVGERDVDGRSDVYALACVAYELLAGETPFSGTSAQQAARRLTQPPPALTARRPDLPAAVDAVLARAMALNPGERYTTASEFAEQLAEALAPPAVTPAGHPARGTSVRARGLGWALTAAAVLAAAGIAAGAWWVTNRRPARPTASAPQMLAVLPFENVGGDTAQLYFADGMTDELATALAKVPGVRVAARTSSYAFRGRQTDVRDVGRQLGVAAVLTGAVRRAGPRLRVTAQLADARTGLVRWTDAYSADSGDVFAVQTRLAGAIVQALAPSVGRAAGARGAPPAVAITAVVDTSRGTDDPEAYDLYLRARHLWYQRRDLPRAAALFRAATARDPRFARAYAGLAMTYTTSSYPWHAPDDLAWEMALDSVRAAAGRALALDSTNAEAHLALADALAIVGRFPEGEPHFRRALALDPRSPTAHQWYGDILAYVAGRLDEGLAQLRAASALDPLSPVIANVYAHLLATAGRRDEAVAMAVRMRELDSALAERWQVAADVWMRLGEYGRAAAELEASRRRPAGISPEWAGVLAAAYARSGRPGRAREIVADLERRDRAALAAGGGPGGDALGEVQRGLLAAYAGLGDTAQALDVLERLVAAHRGRFLILQDFAHYPWPIYAPLTRTARFARLRARVEPQS